MIIITTRRLIATELPPSHHTCNRHAPPLPPTKVLAFFLWMACRPRTPPWWLVNGRASHATPCSERRLGSATKQTTKAAPPPSSSLPPEAASLGTQSCGRAVLRRCPFIVFCVRNSNSYHQRAVFGIPLLLCCTPLVSLSSLVLIGGVCCESRPRTILLLVITMSITFPGNYVVITTHDFACYVVARP